MRAVLLARATIARLKPRRATSACSRVARASARLGSRLTTARVVDHLAPEVVVCASADAAEPGLAAGCILPRHQSDPSRHLTAGAKLSAFVDGSDNRRSDDRTDAGSLASRRQVAFVRQRRTIVASSFLIRRSRSANWSNSSPKIARARSDRSAAAMATGAWAVNRHGPYGGTMPYSASKPRVWLINAVRWQIRRTRARCSDCRSCWSVDFTGTKCIVRRMAGSKIASASTASFFEPLTKGFTKRGLMRRDFAVYGEPAPGPMMRAGTSLHCDRRRCEDADHLAQLGAADLPRQDHSVGVNAVQVK